MENDKIKEMLLDIHSTGLEFTVTQTGKESNRVNGLYMPDTHEILLHSKNFKTEYELVYTAVHEYTHHLITEETLEINPAGGIPNAKVHTQAFWAKFNQLLEIAEQKGYYKIDLDASPELKELTEEIRTNYIAKNGQLMVEFGKLLVKAHDLCKAANIRYEDYLDRILCLPRNTAKDVRKVASVAVNPAIGFDNMKVVAAVKKVDDRHEVEENFMSGKSPATVKELLKQKAQAAKHEDPKTKLERERNRLEKTIHQLQQRLEMIDEQLNII